MNISENIIKCLRKSRIQTSADLDSFKRKVAKKYKIPCLSNIELLRAYHNLIKKGRIKRLQRIENFLKTRPIRSLSGIVNVSVLTKPYPCPGKCIFCPIEKGIPKSYLSGEPAVERAKVLNFNPYWQVKKRIEMLKNQGHPTDKIELRIVGGTWSYYPKNYQTWFIKECFRAANEFQEKPQLTFTTPVVKVNYVVLENKLKKEQKRNEGARHRIVGLSIETRPDFITISEIKRLRKLGVTMVELGVQSIDDDVLKLNRRGHGKKETILATKLLKDAGFKVLYQMMPNLPGSNLKTDKKIFRELFSDSNFQPDLLKIYPCALLKEAPLYKWWLKGKYKPYSDQVLINLIKAIKRGIPYYVRIQRLVRDIPSPRIVAGCKISNLRQIIAQDMAKEGWKCKCIRCREVKADYNPKEKLYLFRQDYEASKGREIFLSFESIEADKRRLSTPINAERKLYALLRLRIPSQFFQKKRRFIKILNSAAIIREIHTYGQLVPISQRKIAPQHRGLGKRLIAEAERIVKKEFGLEKIAVISATGTRDYFRKLNYKLKETYMLKPL